MSQCVWTDLTFSRTQVFQAPVTTSPLQNTLVTGPYVTEVQQPFRDNYGQASKSTTLTPLRF